MKTRPGSLGEHIGKREPADTMRAHPIPRPLAPRLRIGKTVMATTQRAHPSIVTQLARLDRKCQQCLPYRSPVGSFPSREAPRPHFSSWVVHMPDSRKTLTVRIELEGVSTDE